MIKTLSTSRLLCVAALALLSNLACDTAPTSIGDDAPPLPPGTRTQLLSLPELAPSTFEMEEDGTIWLGALEVDLETYDPEGWSPARLGRIDPDGEVTWLDTFFEDESYIADIAAASTGIAVLIQADPPRLDFRDDDGTLLWTELVEGFGLVEALGPDLILGGGVTPDEGPRYATVRRLAPSGEILWETPLNAIGPGDRVIQGLEVDDHGVVWVAGSVRDNVMVRWWVARLDEDGVVLSELFSEHASSSENGYKLSLHGDTATIASSPIGDELHDIDAQGELVRSWTDESPHLAGQVVATAEGTAFLANVHDQPEERRCMTPWSPCPDALLIRYLSHEGDASWSVRQEDCAWGVQTRVQDGALLVLSVCIENGTGARSIDLSRYAL